MSAFQRAVAVTGLLLGVPGAVLAVVQLTDWLERPETPAVPAASERVVHDAPERAAAGDASAATVERRPARAVDLTIGSLRVRCEGDAASALPPIDGGVRGTSPATASLNWAILVDRLRGALVDGGEITCRSLPDGRQRATLSASACGAPRLRTNVPALEAPPPPPGC